MRLILWGCMAAAIVTVLRLMWQDRVESREAENPARSKLESGVRLSGSDPQYILERSNRARALRFQWRDLSEREQAELETKFNTNFRPAIERWFQAFEGRVPFRPEEVTIANFHSHTANRLFTFMIGTTTFVIRDMDGNPTVAYLMTRRAAKELNSLPGKAVPPTLKPPVTRELVIQMVRAETGIEFKPSEILMRPTAAASGLEGGAFVDVLPAGLDPNNALNYVVSMVFDDTGTLVNYERSSTF